MKLLSHTLVVLALTFAADASSQYNYKDIAGKWRGEFSIRPGILVPFNFEIADDGVVYLLNAEERFRTDTATIDKDSLFIPLDQFDNELALRISGKKVTGVLRKQDLTGVNLAVQAEKGKTIRFKESKKPASRDLTGTYDVEFSFESGKKEKSVALFRQEGKKITGTFLKESGDARYLEGIAEGNTFQMSSFIGSTPGFYRGTIDKSGNISGEQLGTRIRHTFKGKLDENATLPDPYRKTSLNERVPLADFTFPDVDGKPVSLKDEKYKNKVVIIPVTGTWCPNCIDEAEFLSPWYKENRDRGVEIITIHYERQTDTGFSRKVMSRFRKRFDITYDQVFGGMASSDTVRKTLGLPDFRAFPTTLFIDKRGRIAKIHSGYSGPATGKFYDEFKKEFNEEIDRLLKE